MVSEMIFKDISFYFCILVAMAINKMSTGQKNHLPDRGPLKEHFCKSFVKKILYIILV